MVSQVHIGSEMTRKPFSVEEEMEVQELLRDPDFVATPSDQESQESQELPVEETVRGPYDPVIKLGKEVMKHNDKLSKSAVADVKAQHAMPRCVNDPEHQKLMIRRKDVRSVFIDIMKHIKLDEGINKFLPAIRARIADRVPQILRDSAKQCGYVLPPDLLEAMTTNLSTTLGKDEYDKYMERMYVIRVYVALRLNEILRRTWVAQFGDVEHPKSWNIFPKKSSEIPPEE